MHQALLLLNEDFSAVLALLGVRLNQLCAGRTFDHLRRHGCILLGLAGLEDQRDDESDDRKEDREHNEPRLGVALFLSDVANCDDGPDPKPYVCDHANQEKKQVDGCPPGLTQYVEWRSSR